MSVPIPRLFYLTNNQAFAPASVDMKLGDYERALPVTPLPFRDVTVCIIPGSPRCRARESYGNVENGRYIDPDRAYVERDRSLRMRRYERIDRAAVYQKYIKTNAKAPRIIWRDTCAFIARNQATLYRGKNL